MSEISDLEKMVNDEKPAAAPNRMPLVLSKIGYSLAIIIIDIVTGWTIYKLSYWYYGVIWFLAGAISFALHQKNWEHPNANEAQEVNARVGMIVSVGSMFIMALVTGGLYIAGIRSVMVEVGIVLAVVVAFFWHSLQLAMFYFADDDWTIQRQISRAKANADKKVKIARAAGDVIAAFKLAQNERQVQHSKHGDARAVDAAIAKMDGSKRPQEGLQGTQVRAFGKDVDSPK